MTDSQTTTVLPDEDVLDVLPDRLMHKQGCPQTKIADRTRRPRVEHYTAVRPGVPEQGIPPREVGVEHCLDCGSHFVKEPVK